MKGCNMNSNKKILILSLFVLFLSCACSQLGGNKFCLTDAKIVTDVDEKLMPVKVTDVFPKGIPKVFCWFKWQNAKANMAITAKWHYLTDNIHILDYTFKIPRKDGSGGVSLAMPEGKALPSGAYRLDLAAEKHILKSLTFKVE